MGINRIQFGNTLWHQVVLPSIAYAAGVWFNPTKSAKSFINSSQYQLGKAILKLNSTPSTAATIGDLGWLPISDHLDILQLGYYRHILQLPDERLSKLVYKELLNLKNKNTVAFNYHQHIKDILADKGICLMIQMHYVYKLSNALSMCYNE